KAIGQCLNADIDLILAKRDSSQLRRGPGRGQMRRTQHLTLAYLWTYSEEIMYYRPDDTVAGPELPETPAIRRVLADYPRHGLPECACDALHVLQRTVDSAIARLADSHSASRQRHDAARIKPVQHDAILLCPLGCLE